MDEWGADMKFGLIGCGWIAEKAYIPAFQRIENAAIEAVFDPDKMQLRNIQSKYHIPFAFDSVEALLDCPIDAVIIAAPNYIHTRYSNMALEAGKHVLCEKPVALTAADIQGTVDLAKKKKLIFLPGFVSRFRKDVLVFDKMAAQVGKIRCIYAQWVRSGGVPRPGTWITNRKLAGGGVLIDIGTHLLDICLMHVKDKKIDFMRACMEKASCHTVKENAAWCERETARCYDIDVETESSGEIRFADGLLLRYNLNWAMPAGKDKTYIEITGSRGTATFDSLFGFSSNCGEKDILISLEKGQTHQITFPVKNTFSFDAFVSLVEYFIHLIHGEQPDVLCSSDALYVVELIEKLYQSIPAGGN